MKSRWKSAKIGELLSLSRETVEISPLETYKQVTVRLHHKGVVLRGEVSGQTVKSNQYLARQGQFIISRIDARNGAMGIVPKELDGAIVTNDFLTYDIDASRLHPKYLDYLTSTDAFVSECRQASEGTTNRVRLKPEIFAEIEIPLPPLDEQQRIAAILDRLMDLKSLQIEIEQELEDLISSLLQKAFAGEL
jgi:type I restriction enzyme S subunit